MALAKVKLDESTTIDFGVSITGADGKPEARFVVDGPEFSIMFPCTTIQEGVSASIKSMAKILPAGEYNARLEVVLENKLYTPLIDKIEFEPSVAIETRSKVVPQIKESVKVATVTVNKQKIDEEKERKEVVRLIANALNFDVSLCEGKNYSDIIERAIEEYGTMNESKIQALESMLEIAEEVGIKIDRNVIQQEIQIIEKVIEEKKEVEDDGYSEEELDKMANEVNDWDDIVDAYDAEELHLVDSDTGEHVDDLKDELKEEELNEVLSRAERIRARIRFHKSAAKRERKLQVALKRHSDSATINRRARHLAVKMMETKLARKPLNQLSVGEKERVEKLIAKRKNAIARLALKLTSKIRKIEKERLTTKS